MPRAAGRGKKVLKMAREAYTETPEGAPELPGRRGASPRGSSSSLYPYLKRRHSFFGLIRVYSELMLMGSTANDFVGKISKALTEAERKGIYVTAGAGPCDLKGQQFGRYPSGEEEQIPLGRPHHLETPPGPRDPGQPDGPRGLLLLRRRAELARDRAHRDGPGHRRDRGSRDRQPLREAILAHAAGEPAGCGGRP